MGVKTGRGNFDKDGQDGEGNLTGITERGVGFGLVRWARVWICVGTKSWSLNAESQRRRDAEEGGDF